MTGPTITRPTIPNIATLPLPREWAAFLSGLLAYAAALEARIAALEGK
ncbi:hypothetical protein [Methylorubrum suomiense]|uniref:Uncharacterized protein n=1 Tax=Methylorubrum suomiense TaxID=144191 RepID=A0ABQ4UUT4_9HYPH|nr:hypothetical protein [Methylorubrum suomiense]GJE75883.1 hypothetical protein BGCPKDLD_2470 [Methylorubrum suomiense]